VVLVTGEEDIAFPLARWFTHYRLAPAATEKSSPLRKARIAAREAWPSLESTDPDVRLTAVEAAVQGSEARRVSVLIAALRDFWHEVRAVAAIGLGLIGEPETVPALAMAMGDPHPGVRTAAVNAIGQIGGVRARAVLAGGLGAYYPEVRLAAALALGLAGSATLRPIAAAATAGAYVGCIPPGGMSVRTAVLGVAAQMGAASPHSAGHILPLLLGAARDECVWVRAAAAEALGFLGAFGGTECAQAAARLLGDSEAQVRRAALVGLMRMGSAAAPALLAALGDRDPAVRWLTVHLLGRLASEELAAGEMAGCEAAGESAPNEKVVAALAAALKDPYAAVRWLAAETLVEIRSASPTAAEALLLARQDRNPLVRAAAQSSSRAGKAAVGEP
jgi:HEAT repeat protein